MRHGKSVLTGMIFAAEDCDYTVANEEGLACPFCHESIYLVGAANKISSKGKEFFVGPHFSHRKLDLESSFLGQICEARAKTKEGQAFLKHFSVEARGQRAILFDRKLWQMLIEGQGIPQNLNDELATLPIDIQTQVPAIIEALQASWKCDRTRVTQILRKFIQFWADDRNKNKYRLAENDLSSSFQHAIAEEVILYLANNRARECFVKLAKLAILDTADICLERGVPFDAGLIGQMAVSRIALLDWKKAIQKQSKMLVVHKGFGRKS